MPDIMSKTTLSKDPILTQVWKFIKWVPNLYNSAANYNITLTNGRSYLYRMGKSVTLICPWVYHRVNYIPYQPGKYLRLTLFLLYSANIQLRFALTLGRVIVLKRVNRVYMLKIIVQHTCIFLFCNACGYVGFIQIMVTKHAFLICNEILQLGNFFFRK